MRIWVIWVGLEAVSCGFGILFGFIVLQFVWHRLSNLITEIPRSGSRNLLLMDSRDTGIQNDSLNVIMEIRYSRSQVHD